MVNFNIKRRVDLAYVLLGSLYVKSKDEFFEHLDSVSKSLKPGGLYILDGVVWFNISGNNEQSWNISRNKTKIKATFCIDLIDPVAQVFSERLIFKIDDNGKKKRIYSNEARKLFFP